MRKKFVKAAKDGDIIKTQNFVTARGVYQLIYVRHNGNVYMYKHLNGKLVECCNLNEIRGDAVED